MSHHENIVSVGHLTTSFEQLLHVIELHTQTSQQLSCYHAIQHSSRLGRWLDVNRSLC